MEVGEPGREHVAGLAAAIASASAANGAEVQLVGRVGDDREGDAVLRALASRGVRHAAVIRDAGRPTRRVAAASPAEGEPLVPLAADDEPTEAGGASERPVDADGIAPALDAGDLVLALGYLVDPRVIVVAEPLTDAAAAVVADAAAFADAAVVAIVPEGGGTPMAFDRATVLVAPADDVAGAFARLVGRFAAALDGGADPGLAFERARNAEGWETTTP